MAYRIEYPFETNVLQVGNAKPDIVIDGFEGGIASSPYNGIADIRNLNITSIPKEVSVHYQLVQASQTPVVQTFTANVGANTINYGTKLLSGTAVKFTTTTTLPAPLVVGTVYWATSVTSTSCILSSTPIDNATIVTITDVGTGTHTLTTVDMGEPNYYASDVNGSYSIDANGRVWKYISPNWVFENNGSFLSNAHGNGIVAYKGYLFAFRDGTIDYIATANIGSGSWANWAAVSINSTAGSSAIHMALVGQDDIVYYCDGSFLGSFFEVSGKTFNPGDATTYTPAKKALLLPTLDTAQWLTELGIDLLVSGTRIYIYPWDRTSTSYRYPILVAESNTTRMITVNTNAYFFAGNRGRIYITNGSQAQEFFKIPDYLVGVIEPQYSWKGVAAEKNQLYFSFKCSNHTSTATTTTGAVWALDLGTKAFRCMNQLSYGTYAGYASVIIVGSGGPDGTDSIQAGWYNGSTYGFDEPAINQSNASPYSNFQAYIETDMIPVGTLFRKYTPSQVEFKLTAPLVASEQVRIKYRTDLSQSFSTIGTTTFAANTISDVYTNTFENAQWIQLRVELSSTLTTPSFCRLRELRIR